MEFKGTKIHEERVRKYQGFQELDIAKMHTDGHVCTFYVNQDKSYHKDSPLQGVRASCLPLIKRTIRDELATAKCYYSFH